MTSSYSLNMNEDNESYDQQITTIRGQRCWNFALELLGIFPFLIYFVLYISWIVL